MRLFPFFLLSVLPLFSSWAAERPNIVMIYADDLGYGDIGCQGATKVKTPRIDALAAQALRFTDAHCSSATCTPSRFSLMTGRYAFRQKGTGVLPGDARLIIAPGTPTLPGILQHAGYKTGAVGKWHLGLGSDNLDWNQEIKPGPLEIGFDHCFILPATGDRVPCVYVRDRRVVGLDPKDPLTVSYKGKLDDVPTGREFPELLKLKPSHGHDETIVNGISRIGYMHGGKSAWWNDEKMAEELAGQAVSFIEEHQKEPFFLYFATHDIHVPRVPNPTFAGKTELGPRGDVIEQLDWEAGQVLDALDRLHLAENTIVIFSSDNGPVVDDGYQDGAVEKLDGHKPAGPWRGGKYSAYEGGTRVPFLVRWPGHVKPGVSSALVGQQDLLASLAALVGQPLESTAGPDSFNVLPALLGQDAKGRASVVEFSSVLGLRVGDWKYIRPSKGPIFAQFTHAELGHDPAGMLFDLSKDPGEQQNLVTEQPAKAQEMAAELTRLEKAEQSRSATP
jgi:arylsulfatase A-like enzyme